MVGSYPYKCYSQLQQTMFLFFIFHLSEKIRCDISFESTAILVAGKGRGEMFLFHLFIHFHSCSSFFPVPLFHLFYFLFYLFSPFLWETTQNDPQGLTCRKTPNNQSTAKQMIHMKYKVKFSLKKSNNKQEGHDGPVTLT